MAGSLIKIKEIIQDLNPSEKKVAQYIVDNPSDISHLSIGELAEKSGSSEATVVRLCKLLDFKGYKDFKISITRDIAFMARDDEGEQYTDVEPGDDLKSIIQNISYNNKKSIENTLEIISYKAIEEAVEAISKADRIEFYGVGASHIIALDAAQKFSRINKVALAYPDPHVQIVSAANLNKGDVAIAVSYSGETKDTYESISVAKESGATTISITKFGQSTISDFCDINLFVSAPEISIRSGAMSSRIAQLNVIDILFTGVASKDFDKIKKHLNRTRKATREKKSI
ncbi:MurR/RpiR family transcriptional regulator [Clostridium swellfunianum]|uniref:MurR/RpiR family transcriptional regulator n=1 Tax=Clostridium swellfunianum TaxID=1367462 RepID=UPI00202E2E28|nr:MurR/RpiR family transcriptional regulator [Clostridium swellfunianum]MCM0649338.1 MurR/RpiR family transcriptional regulator [Clostridium swellfunianum]